MDSAFVDVDLLSLPSPVVNQQEIPLQEENTALKEEKKKLKATMLEDVEKQMTC